MGQFPGGTGKSFQGISKRTMAALHSGRAKMDVFDPALANGCVTPTTPNITWHPIRTATNDAFGSALVRWMMEHKAYNAEFLSLPNYQAGVAGGYASYTDATHLVIVDESHANYRKFMRAEDAGIEDPGEVDAKGAAIVQYVVIDAQTGDPALHTKCSKGDLEFEGEVNGVKVRTAFLMFRDTVMQKTMDEYSKITGVPVDVLEATAKEFTSHGVKASANSMGGTAVVNGAEATMAYRLLNAMIGSNQMTGGSVPRRNSAATTSDGTRYKIATISGKPSVSVKNATYISRNACAWKKTDEYKNRKAKGEDDPKPLLPWFPSTTVSDNQAIASIVNQYPYQAKILFSWMSNTIEAAPGFFNDEVRARLCDPDVVPLFLACDVFMGEMASMADYIIPDTTPYESFGVVTNEGYWPGRGNTVRWPVKTPESIEISGGRHASYEAFLCDVAKACNVPGFGENAVADADGNKHPINDACDLFLKAVANLAYDTTPVDDITDEEIKLQALDNLPAAWKNSVSEEEWPKVLKVLSRGGRFWPIEMAKGKDGRSAFAATFESRLYSEIIGTSVNPYSGKRPTATLNAAGQLMADQSLLSDHFSSDEFPFVSTNYKPRFRSVSMQANSPIMRDLCAHNYVEINIDDAMKLGIKDGDTVKVTSAGGDVMVGEAMVRAGTAPTTFAVAYGYGHHFYGAKPWEVDGQKVEGNEAIAAGIHLVTMRDPTITDALYYLADNNAAAPGRSGGMYKIEKA